MSICRLLVYSMCRSLYPIMDRGSRLNRQNNRLLYTMVIRLLTSLAPVDMIALNFEQR